MTSFLDISTKSGLLILQLLAGLYWTSSALDFTFYVGSKERHLTVIKAELVVISHDKLQKALLLHPGSRARVSVVITFLDRKINAPIYNETLLLSGSEVYPVSEDISVNLTPYMRRDHLNLPRFRVNIQAFDVTGNRLRFNATDILKEGAGCSTPFIVITTSKKQELAYVTNIIERKKRGTTGFTPDNSHQGIQYKDVTPLESHSFPCQKVKFLLNLADIGWDSWLLIPKTVDIGVCQGTCIDMQGLIPHALAKHKIAQVMPNEGVGEICCQETSYKEIVALYEDRGSLVKSILPQFVVNACKCR